MGHIRCPVTIIHGMRDEVVPAWHGQQLYLALRASARARPLWVDEAGHNDIELVCAQHGDAFLVHIAQFLDDVLGRGAKAASRGRLTVAQQLIRGSQTAGGRVQRRGYPAPNPGDGTGRAALASAQRHAAAAGSGAGTAGAGTGLGAGTDAGSAHRGGGFVPLSELGSSAGSLTPESRATVVSRRKLADMLGIDGADVGDSAGHPPAPSAHARERPTAASLPSGTALPELCPQPEAPDPDQASPGHAGRDRRAASDDVVEHGAPPQPDSAFSTSESLALSSASSAGAEIHSAAGGDSARASPRGSSGEQQLDEDLAAPTRQSVISPIDTSA